MTKEELIALSDLNREDNIKYISSEAQGIAIALDSDRYAPTLCKLERAYICGRRKSEEQIAELEKENAELKKQLEMSNKVYNDNLDYSYHIEEQLTKATNVIKKVYDFVNNDVEYDPENPEVHTKMWNELCADAEQFLKENSTYERIQKAKYNYTN